MEVFHMNDRVIDIKNNKYGIYKGLNVENHLPLVQYDGDNKFTILNNTDDLEKVDM